MSPISYIHFLKLTRNVSELSLTYHLMFFFGQLRVDALLGADDEIPDVLMNFVTVDSDFEEVSEDTVKRLGLHSIMLTPSRYVFLQNFSLVLMCF